MAIQNPDIRVPNLPVGKMVDENGSPTPEELTFRQRLVSSLQDNFGAEGLVAPTQDATNIAIIQNNTVPNPSGGAPVPTCKFGTELYDVTNNNMKVAIDDGAGNPEFKQMVLFDDTTVYPSAGAIAGYALTTFNGTQYKIALYALT